MSHTLVKIDEKTVRGVMRTVTAMVNTTKQSRYHTKMVNSGLCLYSHKGIDHVPLECLESMKEVVDNSPTSPDFKDVINHVLGDLMNNIKFERA